jgi:phosphoglycerate kinase|tara:strand:+ start:726 stop:1919 length:1194 start_codon:yes stop_codon:yes gene_type:complete
MNFENYNFKNKRALVRVDFNVPLDNNGVVTDDTRIKMAIPTITKIINDGGSVILMSHLGRPDNAPNPKFSLQQILPNLEALLNQKVIFCDDCISEKAISTTSKLKSGDIVLLENLRFYKEEKLGNKDFARKLSKHGDVFINDAFGTAHRAHASTAIIADFFPNDKMFGFLIENEIKSVDKVLNSQNHPLTAIVGGAKVSSKITIILKLLEKVDHLIIGGGMAYTFIKAQNGSIGKSLVEDEFLKLALEILDEAKKQNVQLHLPIDSLCSKEFSNDSETYLRPIFSIPDNEMGLDIGSETIKIFSDVITNSSLILWNGPMGVFEMSNFQKGTISVANAIVKATKNNAFSLVGGGDSVAAINLFKLADKVSHVSTGGGAMLEYLEGKELPGIKSIKIHK